MNSNASPNDILLGDVRVDRRVNHEFTYLIPRNWRSQALVGSRVRIPFGSQKILGTLLRLHSKPVGAILPHLKPILEVVGPPALLSPPLLRLAEWMSSYYLCPLDLTLRSIAPAIVQRRSSMRKVAPRTDAELDDLSSSLVPTKPLALTPQQQTALQSVLAASSCPQPKPILLFGVTGSGKTEVYLQAMDCMLKNGRGAILLVPEIALTPQTVERLRARFDAHRPAGESLLAVLHSGLSQGERFREWQRIRSGKARLIVGARSAVFSPVQNLGLIVVDEEHEHSYKQEDHPRYHARDVAVMRGHFEKAVVLLGSATPSLESFHNCSLGKFHLARMPDRIDSRRLPSVRIVDMRVEMLRQKGLSVFSQPLKEAIHHRLERGEQVILYLNRRGYASALICKKCGHVSMCPECSVSLSYHRQIGRLQCHLCGHQRPAPKICPEPSCADPSIRYSGFGTEKLEEAVVRLFPHARVARMDSDTMTHRRDYERTLLRFKMGKLDMLLGTQMIAKGLDFPRVSLVGIIHADVGLHMPDFRSSERTFQQITQVAGRAGRGDVAGEVIVQTFTPHHPAIRHGQNQDFESFCLEECAIRRSLHYPPFGHLTKIEFSSKQDSRAAFVAASLLRQLREILGPSLRALGPAPAPFHKVRGKFRYHLLLRDGRLKAQKEALSKIFASLPPKADVLITADVDPVQML